MNTVETARGPVSADKLGATLMHEHIFIRNPELETNYPNAYWNEDTFLTLARDKFRELEGPRHRQPG